MAYDKIIPRKEVQKVHVSHCIHNSSVMLILDSCHINKRFWILCAYISFIFYYRCPTPYDKKGKGEAVNFEKLNEEFGLYQENVKLIKKNNKWSNLPQFGIRLMYLVYNFATSSIYQEWFRFNAFCAQK